MKLREVLTFLVAAAVTAAVSGLLLTSCGAPPPPPPTEEIAIPKTLLFENTSSVAPKFLRSISYERTETAHKFYIKTTVAVTNYFPELRNLEPRLGSNYVNRNDTGDVWGLLIIGIDRASKSTEKKNVAKFGIAVRTADPDFEFDAVIRLNSEWANANLKDGIPVRAEAGTWYLESYTGGDNETKNYWEVREEKKFQANDNDTDGPAAKFISGAYTVMTNIEEDPPSTNTYRVDANISYDANTGEYVLTIPFTVIDANDINKITAFGVQNSGWRPGSQVNAVIKPLGSDKVIVYADQTGTVKGLPVVTVPKKKDQSPVLIPGAFEDVSLVSFDPSSFFILAGGSGTATIKVTVESTISNDKLPLEIIGPKGTATVTNSTNVVYKGKVGELYRYEITLTYTLGTSSGDFWSSSSYGLTFVTTAGSAVFPVIVGIINVDGDPSDAPWATALSINDPEDDTKGGAGADITNVRVTNDSVYLYVLIRYKTSSWYGGGENPRNVIYISTNDNTGALRLIDVYGWINAIQNNEVKFDMFLLHNANSWGVLAKSDGSPIENWSNDPSKWRAGPAVMNNPGNVEYRIELSALGLSVGQAIKIGVSVVNPGHTGNHEYEAVHATPGYQTIGMYSYTIK